MIKQSDIISVLKSAIIMGDMNFASVSVYCIGALIQSDSIADYVASTIPLLGGYLRKCESNADYLSPGIVWSFLRM